MPGYRKIRRTLLDDPRFGMLSVFSQHLYLKLLLVADDQGRLQGHPAWIRSRAFPYQDIALEEIEQALKELEEKDFILRYQADSMALIQIRNWWQESDLQWAQPSEYPAPEGWKDRIRYSKRGKMVTQNWEGEEETHEEDESDEPGRKPGRKPGRSPGKKPGGNAGRKPGGNPGGRLNIDQDQLKDQDYELTSDHDHDQNQNVAFGGFAASGDGGGDTQDLEFDFSRLEKPPGKAERKAWDAFLRTVGVPSRKLREPVLQALTEGRVTGLDVLAEFTRCFREAREGKLAKPAVAAAVNLARGSHRGGEEDRDPVRWWGVLGEKLQPLGHQGLVPPEEAAWAASQRLRLRKYEESPYAALYVQ